MSSPMRARRLVGGLGPAARAGRSRGPDPRAGVCAMPLVLEPPPVLASAQPPIDVGVGVKVSSCGTATRDLVRGRRARSRIRLGTS